MINKKFIIFLIIIAIGICSTILFYFNNNLYEGVQNSLHEAYQNCNEMTDCKECIDTMTAKDGICYWCDGKCTASEDYYAGCSSSFKNCGTSTGNTNTGNTNTGNTNTGNTNTGNTNTGNTNTGNTNTGNTTTTCPICPICPKLTKLKDNTYISAQ